MPPDTGQLIVRRVWAGDGVDALGQPTPDGKYLTFVDWSTGNLAVRDMSSGEVRHLTDKGPDEDGYPEISIVSPDGKRVAYHWYPGGWVWELHVVDMDGTNRKVLLEDQGYTAPIDWSPDGNQLLLARSARDTSGRQFELLSLVDGSRRVVKNIGSASGHGFFSRDGRFVVIDMTMNDTSKERDIFIVSLEDGSERPLIEHPADDFLLGWVPDSDYVLFASDRTGTLGAWVVPVVGGQRTRPPELVRPDLWNVTPMGFTADGSFFYSVQTSTQSVQTATLDPETARILSTPTDVDPRQIGRTWRPRWSPDGLYLAYRTGLDRRKNVITIRSVETGETREFDFKLNTTAPPRWAPDGKSFLLLGRDQQLRRGIFHADIQTGEVTALRLFDQDGGVSYWAGWSPDQETVYYKVDYGRDSKLVALDVESGDERVLRSTQPPRWISIFAAVSPDGDELAFWERDRETDDARLFVMPTRSGLEDVPPRIVRVISGRRSPWGRLQWTADGRHLLQVFRHPETGAQLWKVPAAGGELFETEFRLEERGADYQFSPDGRRVAFQIGQASREIWVMKNYLPEGG